MAQKRVEKRKVDYDVSELVGERSEANVYGIVLDLSPVKKSSRNPQVQYFDGRITDGVKVARMVCFDSKKRALLDDAREKGTSIGLKKCKVKENRGKYEIIASTATRIDVTDKEYIVDESLKAGRPLTLGSIDQMKDMVVNQQVTLKVKIIQVEVAVNINTNDGRMVRKQECVCADSSGSSRLVLWEIDIGKVEVGHCYELQDVTIRSFEEQKYLSTSSKCVIQDCDDIGEVSEDIEESHVFDILLRLLLLKT